MATQTQHKPASKPAGGIGGLVAERASQYNLDGPDWRFMEYQKYLWNPLMDY
jgi:hypothetical protein